MTKHSLLLDLAKARQAELLHEVKMTRIGRERKASRGPNPALKRLKIFLNSL